MNPLRHLKKLTPHFWASAIGVALALGTGIFLLFLDSTISNKVQNLSYDLPFLLRSPIPTDSVIFLSMDEESHKELKQPFNAPWDRVLHAKALDRLMKDGARAVVFDIVFSDRGPNEASDHALAAALKRNGKVVLASDYVRNQNVGRISWSITHPYPSFLTNSAGEGLSSLPAGEDFVVRSHFHGMADIDTSSLSWATAELVGARSARNPRARFTPRWVNYYGPAGSLPRVSYWRLLDEQSLPTGYFKDTIVFIGAWLQTRFSGERRDEYRTPYSAIGEQPFMSGAEVHATILLNLLRQDWLRRTSPGVEFLVICVVGLAFGFFLVRYHPMVAVGLALATAGIIVAFAYLLFSQARIWTPWLIPLTQIGVATSWAVLFNSYRLHMEKRLLLQTLAFHLSPARAKQLLKRPELLKPGAEKLLISIMFTDIEDFTKMAEGMDSSELANLMNNYFEASISCVHQTDGFLVKLIGDALFAIWNAPISQKDHRERVLRTALLLRDSVENFTAPKGQRLRTRVGVHTGVADVGNFGSTKRFDYTALGENINLASRLEGLNKFLGTDILASNDAVTGTEGKIVTRMLGDFQMKGFEKAVRIHELIGLQDNAAETESWRTSFATALDHFKSRRFEEAEAAFQRTIKLRGGKDGPSSFYLTRIAELRKHPPPENDWAGEIQFKEK